MSSVHTLSRIMLLLTLLAPTLSLLASHARAETANFRCAPGGGGPAAGQDGGSQDALLQIQGGDLIADPKVVFGQPSFDPILEAKPQAFSGAAPLAEIVQTVGAANVSQFAVAQTSSGNLWSTKRSDIYVSKALLNLESAQGEVVVVSRTNTLVRSGGPSSVVVYRCGALGQ